VKPDILSWFVVLFMWSCTTSAAQPTLNLSHDLVPLGIAGSNMVPNQPSLDAGPLFMAGVEYAKAHGIATVVADKGTYYFLSIWNVPGSNTHVAVGGIDNMTIDLHGADLIFTHPLFYGIIAYSSVNAVVENFTVDYQPLPFTQVRVVAVDIPNSQIQYVVEPGWQNPSAFNSFERLPGHVGESMEVLIYRNGQPAFGTRRMLTQLPFTGERFPVMDATAPTTLAAVRPGDVAVITMRAGGDAVGINHCTGCTIRNITAYTSGGGGSGVGVISGQSNTIERVYVVPKPGTDRLVSTTSGVMVGPSGPNNQIRLSRSIRTMDDGFWFFGRSIGTVQSQLGPRSLSVASTTAWTAFNLGDTVPDGSPVSFQRFSDGAVLGAAVIVSQTAPASSPPFQQTFTFDRDLPGNLDGAIMYSTDANQNGANSVIERSTDQSHSMNGGGVANYGLANLAIRGNYIRHSAYYAVFLVQGMTPGAPPTSPWVNVNVSNNVIDGTNITSDSWWFEMGAIEATTTTSTFELMTHSVFSNLNVTNNFVADAGRSAVWVGNTSGGSVTGNYLLDPNSRPDPANTYRPDIDADAVVPLVIRASSNGVVTANNLVDVTSGRMFVTDTQYRELAAYAPGGTLRLSAYNIGALVTPTATLIDADGVSMPVTILNTTAHTLDVQVPAGAALGGAYITLTGGGTKAFATLFVDNQDNVPAVNGCTYEVSLSSTAVPASGGSLAMLVVTQGGCGYQATDADAFVTGAGGTGSGVISIALAANTGAARTTTIEIAGQPFTITQSAAARMTLDHSSLAFAAVSNGAAFVSKTASQTVRLTQTGPGAVPWTAQSNQPWLLVSPTSGSGGLLQRPRAGAAHVRELYPG